jgi:hypothetical protein
MGEAWFMGETRRVFSKLEGDIAAISTCYLQEVLGEIGNGASAFGLLEEWEQWLDYLLPRVIPRCDESYGSWLIEELCSAFLQVDLAVENRVEPEIYRDSVLRTLGQVMMTQDRWNNGKIVVGKVLHPSNQYPSRKWGWTNESGDLAASLIVCLRLIKTEDIHAWVASIFAIECPYWRAQLLTWHVGARALLSGKIEFPGHFDGATPQVDWSWSHAITGIQDGERVADSFFPDGNITSFNRAFEENLSGDVLAKWKAEILEVEALSAEVGQLIHRFECE